MTQTGNRRLQFLSVAALAVASLISCGGGTEVAAPTPTVAGSGVASGAVDGVDMGGSQLVTSGLGQVGTTFVPISGQMVTFGPDGRATLSQVPIATSAGVTVTDGGATTYTYSVLGCAAGIDVLLDATTGVMMACPGSSLGPGSTVVASYTVIRRLYTLRVGVTFPEGGTAQLEVFNVRDGDSAPLSLNATAMSAPGGGVQAFNLAVQTGLTDLAGRQNLAIVADCSTPGMPGCLVLNQLDITRLDISNPIDTCIAGHVTATMTDMVLGDPLNRSLVTLDFDDPTCPP